MLSVILLCMDIGWTLERFFYFFLLNKLWKYFCSNKTHYIKSHFFFFSFFLLIKQYAVLSSPSTFLFRNFLSLLHFYLLINHICCFIANIFCCCRFLFVYLLVFPAWQMWLLTSISWEKLVLQWSACTMWRNLLWIIYTQAYKCMWVLMVLSLVCGGKIFLHLTHINQSKILR